MDSPLSIKNASGKTFSLLNENIGSTMIAPFKVNKLTSSLTPPVSPKRKYHCMEPGCNKSFTTSGHLARHNRIHTGEKNFHCLHPGCPSRFSRQDNMMQHYRTHLSQKARRLNGRNKRTESELQNHSLHVREHKIYFQPLVTRPKRSTTMPSLPHPPTNRPKRALSASGNDHHPMILPPLRQYSREQQQQQQQQQQHEWKPNTQKTPH